jgi:hypothetical protein
MRVGPAVSALVLGAASLLAQGVGGLTSVPAGPVPGPNLVANGGFEAGAGGQAPADWALGGGAHWALDPRARTARWSLRLSGVEEHATVPGAQQTVTLTPGFYTLEGWVKVADLGVARRQSGVRLCLDGRPRVRWWKCTEAVRGTQDWTLLRQPMIAVTSPGAYRVTAGAHGLPDGTAWFDDVGLVEMRPPLLDVFLLSPNFRGMLFDDRPPIVRLAVTMADAPETRRPGARVRVRLVDEADGEVQVSREYPARAGRLVAEVDAGRESGPLLARVELIDPDGDVRQRAADYRLVRTSAAARRRFAAWYDERNVTYLDGRPAFVLGLYNTTGYSLARDAYARGQDGWGNARIGEAPVNMLINYWLGIAPIPALTAYMDDLHGRGISYLHTANFYYADHPQYRTIPYPAAREGDDALNRWIAASLSGHPGLAGFYTADERPAEMVPKVFRQRQALSQGAPGTVTFGVLGDGWEEQAPLWRDALDVIGLDPYPITRPRGQNHLAMAGEWTRIARDAVQSARPVWMVIQYFPLTSAGGWPTADELRAMSWMAIVDGAQGLFYWSFGAKGLGWVKDPAERERRWQDLVRVLGEIKALEPVLLAPDTPVAEPSDPRIRALGKRGADGTRYLFAYNTTNTSVDVTWGLAEPPREAVELGPPPAPVPVTDGKLRSQFGPYQIKRYRIR